MPTPAEEILAKTPLPTHLDSTEIRERLSADLRRRSFYSARVTEMGFLKPLQKTAAKMAAGEIDAASARKDLLGWLSHFGYDAERGGFPADPATGPLEGILDLASRRRLDLILKTQREMAANVARVESETQETVDAFPAWRLERYGSRMVPRADWTARWSLAGDSVGWQGAAKGEMVALKNSPIWQALGDGAGGFKDTLGNPYPPFAYSSGLAWSPVSRADAERLGLDVGSAKPSRATLSPGENEIADAMQSFGSGFADQLERELEAIA